MSDTCPRLVWAVARASSRWPIQSWDNPAPAHGQADALNRVLPDTIHFVDHTECGRRPAFGTSFCAPHARALDTDSSDAVQS